MSDRSELDRLLASELGRWLSVLQNPEVTGAAVRAALHALKGSAGMAGQNELALVISQLGARLAEEPDAALCEARSLLTLVHARLEDGESPFSTRWPQPPPGLRASTLDERFRGEYVGTTLERLSELDEAQAGDATDRETLEHAYRIAHSIKGAAGAVGDDVMVWYCHGLETSLRQAPNAEPDRRLLGDLGRHRTVIGLLLEQPERALEMLRGEARTKSSVPPAVLAAPTLPRSLQPSRAASEQPQRASQVPEEVEPLLRVPSALVARFGERLERIGAVHSELGGTADLAHQLGGRLRAERNALLEIQRLIGPPGHSSVPARVHSQLDETAHALGTSAVIAERGSALCRKHADALRDHTTELSAEVWSVSQTTVGWLFERVRRAVERLSSRGQRTVRIELSGVELPIDRVTAERLHDPLLQLARNALAHGIEDSETRSLQGKPAIGTIAFRAERFGEWLRILVEDDGRGVNITQIARLAVEQGLITSETAAEADENGLLGLLFTPGFTTQSPPDVLAGRGVGLELAQEAVRRLGGGIRLASKIGRGVSAAIEVPLSLGPVDVLWLSAANTTFAIPVGHAGRISVVEPPRPVSLASCLGIEGGPEPRLCLEVWIHGVHPIQVGIDGVGEIEQVSIRPLPDAIASVGPYGGAVLRPDGSLALVLEAAMLAARAWLATSALAQH